MAPPQDVALGAPGSAEPSARAQGVARLGLVHAHVVAAGTALLLLPEALFALHMRPLAGAVTLVGVAAVAAIAIRPAPHGSLLAGPLAPLRLSACLGFAIALLVVGGEAHLTFSNPDWLWRDAVLSDVARAPFPPTYAVDGHAAVLRAPLGMYMVPALVASRTRLAWGHAAMLAQNAALLSCVLYLLTTLWGRGAALVIAVFATFSGLDIVGRALMHAVGSPYDGGLLPSHVQSWLPFLQYSSVVTQLFWVPNHALPSHWLALLAWACRRGQAPLGLFVASAAACLFWTPFATLGALPLGLYLFARSTRAALSSGWFWCGLAAAACFAPVALYLQAGAADVPHRIGILDPVWLCFAALFLILDIPQAIVVGLAWRRLPPDMRGLTAVSIGVLLALPMVQFGKNNDLVMRASIPALTLLAVAFASVLRDARLRSREGVAALALIGVGAVTPATEVVRAFAFGPFGISDCDLVTVWTKLEPGMPWLANYLARPSPALDRLLDVPAAPSIAGRPDAVCWPDLPVDPRMSLSRFSNAQLLRARRERGPPGL